MHPEQTILELRAALEQSPSNGILRGALARLLASVGRHAEAEVEHCKVLAASPEDVDAKLALAECFHAQGKDSHVLVLLYALKLRGQLEGRAAVLAARLHLRAGELVAAQALYSGAIRHDPALADADLARALRARPPLRVPRRVRQGDRSLAHSAGGASLLRLRGLADLDPRPLDRRPARGTRLAGVAGAQAQARARLPPPDVRAVAAGRVVRPAVAPRLAVGVVASLRLSWIFEVVELPWRTWRSGWARLPGARRTQIAHLCCLASACSVFAWAAWFGAWPMALASLAPLLPLSIHQGILRTSQPSHHDLALEPLLVGLALLSLALLAFGGDTAHRWGFWTVWVLASLVHWMKSLDWVLPTREDAAPQAPATS